MTFRGWPAEALEFFEGLEADNSKTYWHEHKSVYEQAVKTPMVALLAELEPEFGVGKVFRPNRDIRFSADKSPYKTNIAATLAGGGYVSLSSGGLAAGCGTYHMTADQLARFRAAVDDDGRGKELVEIVAAATARGIEIGAHEQLKSAPRGYAKDHPRVDLLRHKGLISWRSWPVAPWLGTAKAKDRVVALLRDSRPMVDWLARNVGPPEA